MNLTMKDHPSHGNAMTRRWLFGLATAVAMPAVIACGNEGPSAAPPAPKAEPPKAPSIPAATAAPTSAPVPTKAAEQVEVTFHSRGGAPTSQEIVLYEEQMPLFMQQFPSIRIKHEGFTNEDYIKKLTVLLASNSVGDSLFANNAAANIFQLIVQKALRPLDDAVAASKFDLAPYFPGSVAALRRDGKLYGLPFKSSPGRGVLYYNQSLLEARGAGVPTGDWTLEKLVGETRKVEGGELFGHLPGVVQQNLIGVVRAHGGELVDAEGRKSLLNSPEAATAIAWIYDLIHARRLAPAPSTVATMGGDAKAFGAGKVATLRNGTSFHLSAQNEVKDQFKWFVTVHPKGPGGTGGSSFECDGYTIAQASRKADQAWEWVRWITRQEAGIRLAEIGGTAGGRVDVYRSPRLLKFPERQVFLEAMEQGAPFRPVFNTLFADYEAAINAALTPLWEGKETPGKSFLDGATALVQQVLDRPLP